MHILRKEKIGNVAYHYFVLSISKLNKKFPNKFIIFIKRKIVNAVYNISNKYIMIGG